MAVWAIGDVQGCYDALARLLDKINFTPRSDQLWFCGDLIGRGKQPLETLRLIRSLTSSSVIVLGNHDINFMACCHGGGIRSEGDNLDQLIASDQRFEICDWLRQQKLFHYQPHLGWAMVHAAVDWQWSVQDCIDRSLEVEGVLQAPDYAQALSGWFNNHPNHWHHSLTGVDRASAPLSIYLRGFGFILHRLILRYPYLGVSVMHPT